MQTTFAMRTRTVARAYMYGFPLWTAAIVAAVALFGCKGNQWKKIDVLGDEAVAGLQAQAKAWEHRPDRSKRLLELAESVEKIDAQVHLLAEGGTPPESLDAAIVATQKLIDSFIGELGPGEQDLAASLGAARFALGLARAALA